MIALPALKRITHNSTVMYNLRMIIAFGGITFIPYFLGQQMLTIPLILGVVAAGLSDIDDRFSVRIRNLFFTYVGFFCTSAGVELLSPYPVLFALGLIISCFCLILLGSLGKRYASISYGCLVISVYSMLGLGLFDEWYMQPSLLTIGAIWYGILSTLSFLFFPMRLVQQQIVKSYRLLGRFLFLKSNVFDVDMTPESHQQSMIELSMHNALVTESFNNTRLAIQTRLKSDRGQVDTRRSLQYYFIAQDIHERADSAHIDYQELSKVFKHRDILFRFQRILSLQGKACEDLALAIEHGQIYIHNKHFQLAFQNLHYSLNQLEQEKGYDFIWLNALRSLERNLKAINAQLKNLESEREILKQYKEESDHQLSDDDLTGWQDIKQRIKQNFSPESGLFRHAMRLSILLVIAYIVTTLGGWEYGSWLLMTILFVCQPNFNATRRRLKLRIIGTLAGIAGGAFVLLYIHAVEAQLLLLILSGVLFFHLRSQQYAQATLFITLLAVINLHLIAPGWDALLPRAFFTVAGCFMAWFGIMYLWPDWKYRQLSKVIHRSLKSQCDYLAEIVQQYHTGRNHALKYRVMRRNTHLMDAELASTISTLATEPHVNVDQKQLAFKFLCISHTMLGYIAALGSHRKKIEDKFLLQLLDQTFQDMQTALLNSETRDLHLKFRLNTLNHELQQQPLDEEGTMILQQITLILKLLPELSQLSQKLSLGSDTHEAALSPL